MGWRRGAGDAGEGSWYSMEWGGGWRGPGGGMESAHGPVGAAWVWWGVLGLGWGYLGRVKGGFVTGLGVSEVDGTAPS